MPLLKEREADFVFMVKVSTNDNKYGGYNCSWHDGYTFKAAIALNGSTQPRIAEVPQIKPYYTVITDKSVILKFYDVIKRESDGKTFRITSNGDENYTPDSASLNMRAVTAEEWTLPNG